MTAAAEDARAEAPLPRGLWLVVALGVVLAVARGAAWEHRHDEGTTYDLAVGMVLRDMFVDAWPEQPVPITSLYDVLDGRSDYDLVDAVMSVHVPGYRMFHPPGYYALLHLWTKVFGTHTLVLRIPAYVLAALAILAMALIARRVVPEAGGPLWSAAVFATCPWIVSITNFARPYHLALFLAVWSTLAVLEMARERPPGAPRSRWWIAFVVCSTLGLYTLYHYGFVLLWHGLFLAVVAWRRGPGRRRRAFLGLAGCAALVTAGFAPWLRDFSIHVKVSGNSGDYFTGGVPTEHVRFRALYMFRDYALADSVETLGNRALIVAVSVLGAVSLPLVLWAFLGPARRRLRGDAALFWITAPALPLLIGLSDLWRGTHTILITKICFAFVILLVLALVRGWLCAPRVVRTLGLAAWVVVLGSATLLCTYTRASTPSGSEKVASMIAQADDGKHLLVISTGLRGYSVPLLLSLRDAGVDDVYVTRCAQPRLPDMLRDVAGKPMFRRVSLLNFMIPQHERSLMWDREFMKELADELRQTDDWVPFHDADRPWLGIPSVDGVMPTTRFREVWFFEPVKMRFFHGTF